MSHRNKKCLLRWTTKRVPELFAIYPLSGRAYRETIGQSTGNEDRISIHSINAGIRPGGKYALFGVRGDLLRQKSSTKLFQHIIELNRIISNRINNCKPFFPLWLNWKYIQDLFIMPDGFTETGTKNAATLYYQHKQDYPYQMYMNWNPSNEGNILYNDKKFVTLLYRWHGDTFTEYNRVSDVSTYVKGSIQEFIGDSTQAVIVVDCENSDPYKLCATLKGLDYRNTAKISRILLFDDIHTASAWRILDNFTKISVEHILTERVKQNKSLVDIKLTARACQEHYQNHVDSFIIVSSDSDYWGLISSLPEARFLVMVEREKCSHAMKQALAESGIFIAILMIFIQGMQMV